MLKRLLIRLRFMPVLDTMFDRLPVAVQIAWFGETGTVPPGTVVVPPGETYDGPRGAKERRARASATVIFFGLVGFLLGGVATGMILSAGATGFLVIRTLRKPRQDSRP
jgi:hypothetical protein